MLKLKVKINADTWRVYRYSDGVFNKKFRQEDLAVTVYQHAKGIREFAFRRNKASFNTIVHEVLHAYLSYKDLSKMSYGQIEETLCELVGKHLVNILAVSRRIQKGLK